MEAAMTSYPDAKFQVAWKPFFLNSKIPEEGMDWKTYMAQKGYGNFDLSGARARLSEVGATVGIKFKFDTDQKLTPTLKSHRLVHYAGRFNKTDEVMEEVFKSYFEQCVPLGSVSGLVECARKAGLDPEATEAYLNTNEDEALVRSQAREYSQDYGVSGVPFFIIYSGNSQKFAFSGAQPAASFLQVFRKVLRR